MFVYAYNHFISFALLKNNLLLACSGVRELIMFYPSTLIHPHGISSLTFSSVSFRRVLMNDFLSLLNKIFFRLGSIQTRKWRVDDTLTLLICESENSLF